MNKLEVHINDKVEKEKYKIMSTIKILADLIIFCRKKSRNVRVLWKMFVKVFMLRTGREI